MKTMKSFMLAFALLFTASAFAQAKTESFKVYGNCGMCKKRIEKAVQVEGVTKAEWSAKAKMLTVTYDQATITNDDLQKKIAAVGHDTEKFSADDKVYEKLPGCCLYDRKKEGNNANAGHNH